jgi:hypothetical protein
MNLEAIDSAFHNILNKKKAGLTIGISSQKVARLRYSLRRGVRISTDYKIRMLQRAGWRQDDIQFSQRDMVEAVKFALRSGRSAQEMGAEYLVEKFKASRASNS